jgi:putative membrane protein
MGHTSNAKRILLPIDTVIRKQTNWFGFLWHLNITQTFRQLLLNVLLIGLYAYFFIYINEEVLKDKIKISPATHSMLGITLGLLLVFRTNTAYDRWWEGRKLVGQVTNACRNLAIKLHSVLPVELQAERMQLAALIATFPVAMKEHLRGHNQLEQLVDLTDEYRKHLESLFHRPNQVLYFLLERIVGLKQQGYLSEAEYLGMERNISELTDAIGGCERIKSTPLPVAYRIQLKIFILIYILTIPFGLAHELHYWTVPATMLIFYALVGIEVIGEMIEDPFGVDEIDIPLDAITQKIRHNVFEILRPELTQKV